MERINLNNYEAFFLDYIEGNLPARQEFELIDFLNRYPELRDELDIDLDELRLKPEALEVDKNELKHIGIGDSEVDDLMIASVEGLLGKEEQTELDAYISKHQLEKKFSQFKRAILVADSNEVFENKESLKKKVRLVIPLYWKVAAAAAVIVILARIVSLNTSDVEEQTDVELAAAPSELPFVYPRIMPLTSFYSTDQGLGNSGNQTNNGGVVKFKDEKEIKDEFITVDQKDTSTNFIKTNVKNQNDKLTVQDDQIEKKEDVYDDIEIAQNPSKSSEIIIDEPIKLITDVAGNVFNREVSYQRGKTQESDEYVTHHIKLGKFEFERKKH